MVNISSKLTGLFRVSRLVVPAGFLLALVATMNAQAIEMRVSAGKVQYENLTVTGLVADLRDGGAVISVQNVLLPTGNGLALQQLDFACDTVDFAAPNVCNAGRWSLVLAHTVVEWQLPVNGVLTEFSRSIDEWTVKSSVASGKFNAHLSALFAADKKQATFDWNGQLIRDLPTAPLIPEQVQWVREGTTSAQLTWQDHLTVPASLSYQITLDGLGFDSPEGRFAGEDLGLQVKGNIQLGAELLGQVSGSISSGAVLIDNFYTSFADQELQWGAMVHKDGSSLRLTELRIHDGGALEVEAEAELDLDRPAETLVYRLDRLEMHFPQAYEKYIESMAAAWTLDGLNTSGKLLWSEAHQGGVSALGLLEVLDMTIVDGKRGRFALTGLEAHIVPGDRGLDSRFSWRGMLLQSINLGAGEVAINSEPDEVSLASPLELDILGGRLALEDLRVILPGKDARVDAEPEIRLYATLDNLDMKQLTQALDWPVFDGTVSGKIPGVTLRDGVLAVEGQIEFNVFSGQVLLSDLHVERPFGVLPSLAANLEARDLNLQQLTQTFSFGKISGRMDGFVHDLRMLDWRPVAFDAWFGTPEQATGSHDISRQAVNHLTTLGGGRATAALTGPVMKLFNNFSYRRLGLGCRLQNNICEVRGLDDDVASVLIMEGAGVPKIMIRAFNRQMDFQTLIAGLTAAAAGESIKIGN